MDAYKKDYSITDVPEDKHIKDAIFKEKEARGTLKMTKPEANKALQQLYKQYLFKKV